MNHHQHERHLDAARRHLTLAAHALLTPSTEGKADAILFAGLALLDLAKSDPEERALESVIATCERARTADARRKKDEGK